MNDSDLSSLLNPPMGPFVIFVARSSKCHNGTNIHGQKLWLRRTMFHVETAFNAMYGKISNRPSAYCAFVHESNDFLQPTNDGIQYLSSFMQRAQEARCEVILVISGWCGLTTDEASFINLLKDFKDIKVTLRVYASFMPDLPRKFWQVDAHKVSEFFQGNITLEDDSETDHSALFAGKFQFIHDLRASMEESCRQLMDLTGKSREEVMEECKMVNRTQGESEYGQEFEVHEETTDSSW